MSSSSVRVNVPQCSLSVLYFVQLMRELHDIVLGQHAYRRQGDTEIKLEGTHPFASDLHRRVALSRVSGDRISLYKQHPINA